MGDCKSIVIVGAGGLGREVLATIEASNAAGGEWNVVGFLDSNRNLVGSELAGVRILGDDEWCARNRDDSLRFICAIG